MPSDKTDWLEVARTKGCCNIGQISKDQQRILNNAAKRGEIVKFRAPWLGCYNEKTHYYPKSTRVFSI